MKYRVVSALGAIFGAGGGLAYQHFIGCANGCALKSSALFMTGFGALLGLFAVQMLAEFVSRPPSPPPSQLATEKVIDKPR
jgi:hypothetical protein